MRWGKVAIVVLAALVAFGGTLLIVRDGAPSVDALELGSDDEAFRREDDGTDLEVQEDDDDGKDGTGTRTASRIRAADATDDGRDGTFDGNTSHGQGTGTGADQRTDDGRDGTFDGDTGGNLGTRTGVSNAGANLGGGGGGGTDSGGGGGTDSGGGDT